MRDLIDQFERHFDIVLANNEHLILRCQELRYQIFCREQHIFDEHAMGDYLEVDEYDPRSVHALLRYKRSGEYAATVRIILPDKNVIKSIYPLDEHVLNFSIQDRQIINNISREHLAEISRFSVSKHFRRRVGEKNVLHGVNKHFGKDISESTHRRFDAYITLGLFKAIVKMSHLHGIENWLAFMEPGLIRLLRRVGIVFHRVGPVIDYCGFRHACHADASDVLEGIKKVKPEIWAFITECGRYTLNSQVAEDLSA